MIELEETPGLYCLSAGGLRIAFHHVGDRWNHTLSVRHATSWQALFTSVEGLPNDAIPPSPAFQDLRWELIAEDIHEFQLFGQAGKGVYSAAIRVDGRAQVVFFDIAARSQREGAGLCVWSTYETVAPGPVSIDEAPGDLMVLGEFGALILVPIAPALTWVMAGAPGTNMSAKATVGSPAAERAENSVPPRNARWRYEIHLASLP
jgi:hypothetical protein